MGMKTKKRLKRLEADFHEHVRVFNGFCADVYEFNQDLAKLQRAVQNLEGRIKSLSITSNKEHLSNNVALLEERVEAIARFVEFK